MQPAYATTADHGRYYLIPGVGQPLVSVTNALSALDKPGLPAWYARHTAERAIDGLPRLAALTRAGQRDDALAWLRAAGDDARDHAAAIGTRVHDIAEAALTGRALEPSPHDQEAQPYADQYQAFLRDYDIDPGRDIYAAECTVYDADAGWAGTADLLARLPLTPTADGTITRAADPETRPLWVIDLKTSATRSSTQVLPAHALQVTALSRATTILWPDGTSHDAPPIAGAAILNLRARTYRLIPVPAWDDDAYRAFIACVTLSRWMHTGWAGDYTHRPVLPDGTIVPPRTRTRTPATSPSQDSDARKDV